MANSTVASRASLRLEWPCPRLIASSASSISCQLRPVSPTPPLISTCTYTPKIARRGSVPSFLMKNRLRYWPGDDSPPALCGRQSPMATKSAWRTWIGPVSPVELGGQEVGRALVLLEAIPGRPLAEPVQPTADRQAADDRAEVRAALRVVALARPDEGMQADRGEVDVIGRAAGVDPDRHVAVAHQALGLQQRRADALDPLGQVRADDRVLVGADGPARPARARRWPGSAAASPRPAEAPRRARSCSRPCSRSSRPARGRAEGRRRSPRARRADRPGPDASR